MAQTLKIDNFGDLNIKERSQLNADVAAAATALTVVNNDTYAANDHLYVGALGAEGGEKVTVSGVAGNNTVNVGALKFAHKRYDQITSLFGNKIRIYRASNSDGSQPADGDFSLLSTIDIDFDQAFTQYTDSNGSSSYWYKFTYYNSTSTSESSLADSRAVRGGGVGNYCSVESIRKEAGLQNNRWITDSDVDMQRQAAQARVNSALSGIYTIPFTSPINPLIQQITRLLAAGNLLLEDYGPMTNVSTADGQAKIDKAEALLEKLNTRKLVLTDETGTDTSTPGTAGGYTSWPNEDTADADIEDGGAERMFRMSDRY